TPRSGRPRRSGVCFRHLRRAHLEYAGTQGFSHVSRSSQATRRSVSHRARPPRAKTWCLAMTLLALYLLALLDGILCGLRTATGRNALIRKRWYYLRATIRGLLGAQLASMVALMALIFVAWLSPNRSQLRLDLEASAEKMLHVFLPYAAIVLAGLAARGIP